MRIARVSCTRARCLLPSPWLPKSSKVGFERAAKSAARGEGAGAKDASWRARYVSASNATATTPAAGAAHASRDLRNAAGLAVEGASVDSAVEAAAP